MSLNFRNKLWLCAESGLKSTDERFSEAAVALDSVITAKSRSLMTPAVRLCCTLKRSLNAVGRCWRLVEHGANRAAKPFWNAHASSGILGSWALSTPQCSDQRHCAIVWKTTCEAWSKVMAENAWWIKIIDWLRYTMWVCLAALQTTVALLYTFVYYGCHQINQD